MQCSIDDNVIVTHLIRGVLELLVLNARVVHLFELSYLLRCFLVRQSASNQIVTIKQYKQYESYNQTIKQSLE